MRKKLTKISAVVLAFLFISLPFAFAAGIENPLKGGNSISAFISSIMGYIVRIGGIIAVFMFILTGFKYVEAQGDPGKLTKAKDMFFGTCIGVAVLLGAQLIASIIVGTLRSLS